MVYTRIKHNFPKLIRFGCVGTIGAIINFVVYYVLVKFAHFSVNVGAIGAFFFAVTHNYILNHVWTFNAENGQNPINIHQYVYYFVGNIFGLLINLVVLNLVISNMGKETYLVGQVMGILCGMLSNFLFSKKFVFIEKKIGRAG